MWGRGTPSAKGSELMTANRGLRARGPRVEGLGGEHRQHHRRRERDDAAAGPHGGNSPNCTRPVRNAARKTSSIDQRPMKSMAAYIRRQAPRILRRRPVARSLSSQPSPASLSTGMTMLAVNTIAEIAQRPCRQSSTDAGKDGVAAVAAGGLRGQDGKQVGRHKHYCGGQRQGGRGGVALEFS
jgi:hypothetical protein